MLSSIAKVAAGVWIPCVLLCLACSGSGESGPGGDGDANAGGDGDGDRSLNGSGGVTSGTGGSDGAGGPSGGASMGTGGATASGGAEAATGGSSPVEQSDGCNLPYSGATGDWVEQPTVGIQGADRIWSVYVPDNYDPSHAYPLVVLLHGCGSGTNNVPIQNASGDDAILVRGTAEDGNCWDAGGDANLEFFDAMVAGVGAQACVDENRVFAAGYSSGSWLMSNLGCARADVLRAVGTVAGGDVLWNAPECDGQVGAIFVHDENDEDNDISGSESVRDRLLEQNGCGDPNEISSSPVDPSPCQEYLDCPSDGAVVWCATTGEGHSRQDQFAAPLMWDFFSRFE